MDVNPEIQGAMSLAQSQKVIAPKAASTETATREVAEQFEGVLISQMLNDMFSGVKTDGMFGGGPGEEMFRSLMIDEYGKQIAAQGGLGLSASVTRELLKHQAASQ